MGASNKVFTNNSDSFSVVGGKFTQRVAEGTVGSTARQLTKGKNAGTTVYEIGYPTIEGFIDHGKIVESEIGCTAEIGLKDQSGVSVVSFQANVKDMSQYLKTLIRCLPNLDPSKPIAMSISQSNKKKTKFGGPVFYLGVYQDDRKVSDFYVEWKDVGGQKVANHLHGYPESKKLRDGSYDYSEQNEFLLMKFEEYFADYEGVPAVSERSEPEVHGHDDDGDDCPF